MTIRPELLNELLKDYAKPGDLVGEAGLLKQLTKALVERCLETENRGVQDIFIAWVDGLMSFPEAIETISKKWTMPIRA
jgi:transposase-like protein